MGDAFKKGDPTICGVKDNDCPYLKKIRDNLGGLGGKEVAEVVEKKRREGKTRCPFLQAFIKAHVEGKNAAPNLPTQIEAVLLCTKKEKGKSEADGSLKGELKSPTALKTSNSRELRAGILYRGCDCEKRNGLQDACPRSQCQGSIQCLTIPPTCPPSEFSNGKHLQKKLIPRRQARQG